MTPQQVKFKKYQPGGIDFLTRHQRCCLFAGMGMGKGLMSLSAIDNLRFLGMIDGPTLVLGPLRVARDTWTDEGKKWAHLTNMRIVPIIGSIEARHRALHKDADVYTTNYENLPWLIKTVGNAWPFETVIADESTRLKSFRLKQGGKRARALGEVAFRYVNRWVNLTGTPVPNGLLDLWGQMWFIDQGARLGRSYSAFESRWFHRAAHGGEHAPLVAFPHAEKEIYGLLKDVCMTIDPKDWFNLDEPIVNTIKVKLPPGLKKMYKTLEATMFAELASGTEVEVFNAAALTNKCLQFANGAVYTEGGAWEAVHDFKIEALESVMAENSGTPVLCAYNFVSDKERLLKAFPKAVLLSDLKGLQKFKAGDSPLGIAHAKSMGHGIDGLQNVTNVLARFGHDWNMEERMQMLERIGPVRQAQAGLKRPVMVYDIITEGTIDETVIERHVTKRKVQDLLLEAMKR